MKASTKIAKREMNNIVRQYLCKDEKGQYMVDPIQQLPICLFGPAGIGKTEAVGQIAKENGLGFVSYSLVHHTRQSLMGLPVITSFTTEEGMEMKDTEYTLSEVVGAVYKEVEKGHKEGILLLDEANCCSETIQPMLLSFLQSKVLGSSRLPEGWIIILAGNPPKSIFNKNAREWDGALMDRLRVLELDLNNEEYLDYVYEKDFHPAVKYYLTIHIEDAYICEQKDKRLDLVTYRTWENLSNSLKNYENLGFEVTPIMINQFIKIDRVVRSFYELYRYSTLKSDEYTTIAQAMTEARINTNILESLKDKPVSVLYGITNLCFRQLDQEANVCLKKHEVLKSFKNKIQENNFELTTIMMDERLDEDMRKGLEHIWENVSSNEIREECVKLHNGSIEELEKMKADLMERTNYFFQKLKGLNNTVLTKFFLNTLMKGKAWIYVMAKANTEVIDELKKDLDLEFEDVA